MGNNALREITSEHLQHLTQVSVLDVRDNKISVLPDEITLLEGLQRLDLTNNDLSGLVSFVFPLFHGNPFLRTFVN